MRTLTRLAYCFDVLDIFHLPVEGWKIDRAVNSGKFGNGMDSVEGVDGIVSDSIDRKNDRKGVKAMKTKKNC